MPTLSISKLELKAPVTGVLVPIETIPDDVFAKRIVGDGVSIDPLDDTLVAPHTGEVVLIHSAQHAVGLKTPEGVEILLHIGLDTVNMQGSGFEPQVAVGDRVETGDQLIRFDPEKIVAEASSLLTQMVVTNTEILSSIEVAEGMVSAGSDTAAILRLDNDEAKGGITG